MLDHLTRGRVMLGVGPGALPTDAKMIGLSQTQTRGLLEDSLGVIMQAAHVRGAGDVQERPLGPAGGPSASQALFEPAV